MTASAQPPLPSSGLPTWQILIRLYPFLKPYRKRMLLAGAALLVAAISTLLIPIAFRLLIDQGFSPQEIDSQAQANYQVDSVFLSLFGLAVILATATAFRYYTVSWLGERITADLRASVYQSVIRQDPLFFETLRTGEVLSRLTGDTLLIQTLIGSSISLGIRNGLLFFGALLLMIWTSPVLASIIVALLFIVVLPILLIGRKVRSLSKDSQDKLADTSALAGETLNSIQTVQSYVREDLEGRRYTEVTETAFSSAIKRNLTRSLLTAIAITLVFGSIVFVLWLGAKSVLDGNMSPGLLTQFMLYAALVAGSTGALAEVIGDVQRAAGATERLLGLLDRQSIIQSGNLIPPAEKEKCNHGSQLEFENIHFTYPSRPDTAALKELSFTLKPDETVALVGPSGAGKTTVLQLLLRFYDPDSGCIKFNGTPINQLSLEFLRTRVGLVSQESVVFSDTVRSNILYGNLNATEDSVIQAAEDAQALGFINMLPQGMDTYLGEKGVRLSGGQRQRLSIARALLKDPPLLLLDEATSALDAESERKVQLALNRAMSGRTTLVIAHRLATITNADRILVLDSGKLIQSGTHKELIAEEGLYAQLASMQFGWSSD